MTESWRLSMTELDRLVELLAKLPGLGPALGAARGAPSAEAARGADGAARHGARRGGAPGAAVLALRQSRHGRSVRALPRSAARGRSRLRRRGSGRSLGDRALGRLQGPLSRAGRHAVGARRRRARGAAHRRAAGARQVRPRARGDPGPERHRRGPDHGALHRRPAGAAWACASRASPMACPWAASSTISTKARSRPRSPRARR